MTAILNACKAGSRLGCPVAARLRIKKPVRSHKLKGAFMLVKRLTRVSGMLGMVMLAWALLAKPGLARNCAVDEDGAGKAKVNYVEVYSSKYAMWCVDASFLPENSGEIPKFFAFYDSVVEQMINLFHVRIELPIVVEITTPTGGACACGPRFGRRQAVRVTGSAFTGHEGGGFPGVFVNPNTQQRIPGFFGYLLTIHETMNAFTGGLGGGGWPTDWWADHRSPFPNAMDEQLMRYVGNLQHDQTLLDAAAAQRVRFGDPHQKSYDRQVVMFDDL